LVGWIRIRIRKSDPDPGGQKRPTKKEKNVDGMDVWYCFEVQDFLVSGLESSSILDALHRGLEINILQLLIKKIVFFNFEILNIFVHPYPH
jgi:hypothetical protein